MKINKATSGRPGEDRIIDAPYVVTDISQRIAQLKKEDAWQDNDRNGITVFKKGPFTVVLSCFHKGVILRHNGIEGYTTIQVLEGSIKLTIETESIKLSAREMINLHPEIKHEVEILEDTSLLLINNGL